MARLLPITLSLGLLVTGLGTSADAASSCAPRDKLIEQLASGYGEALAAGGLQSETRVVEVYAWPDTGTWTVLMTNADGVACIMASGTDWHQQDELGAVKGIKS
jgi:predicted methyltransferase